MEDKIKKMRAFKGINVALDNTVDIYDNLKQYGETEQILSLLGDSSHLPYEWSCESIEVYVATEDWKATLKEMGEFVWMVAEIVFYEMWVELYKEMFSKKEDQKKYLTNEEWRNTVVSLFEEDDPRLHKMKFSMVNHADTISSLTGVVSLYKYLVTVDFTKPNVSFETFKKKCAEIIRKHKILKDVKLSFDLTGVDWDGMANISTLDAGSMIWDMVIDGEIEPWYIGNQLKTKKQSFIASGFTEDNITDYFDIASQSNMLVFSDFDDSMFRYGAMSEYTKFEDMTLDGWKIFAVIMALSYQWWHGHYKYNSLLSMTDSALLELVPSEIK